LTLPTIIIVFVCGLVAMVIELFIPGAVMGMLGFLAVVGSIISAIVTGHTTTAIILIVCTVAFVPVFFLLWKSVVGRLLAIKDQEVDFRPSQTINEDLLGAEGTALSTLRPSGIGQLSGERHHVVTRGEMVEKGTRIRVIEVSGNRLVVKRQKTQSAEN